MGRRGPIPKRPSDRKRRNEPDIKPTEIKVAGQVLQPPPDSQWHPIAKRLWEAMGESGQARFYEPSDWAVAYSLMDDLTYLKTMTKRSGQMLAVIMSSLSSLLLTEGDRRRLQLELNRATPGGGEDGQKVVVMDKWKQRLG